jgi:hypothetical protein
MPSSIRQLQPGESCDAIIQGDFYTVTRGILENAFTVWKDNREIPYNLVQRGRSQWVCDCPGFVYRKWCRHSSFLREELSSR